MMFFGAYLASTASVSLIWPVGLALPVETDERRGVEEAVTGCSLCRDRRRRSTRVDARDLALVPGLTDRRHFLGAVLRRLDVDQAWAARFGLCRSSGEIRRRRGIRQWDQLVGHTEALGDRVEQLACREALGIVCLDRRDGLDAKRVLRVIESASVVSDVQRAEDHRVLGVALNRREGRTADIGEVVRLPDRERARQSRYRHRPAREPGCQRRAGSRRSPRWPGSAWCRCTP